MTDSKVVRHEEQWFGRKPKESTIQTQPKPKLKFLVKLIKPKLQKIYFIVSIKTCYSHIES